MTEYFASAINRPYTFLNNRPPDLQLCLKETPAQLFSCEYCEMFKNTYFEQYLLTSASVIYRKSSPKKEFASDIC